MFISRQQMNIKLCLLGCPITIVFIFSLLLYIGVRQFILFEAIPSDLHNAILEFSKNANNRLDSLRPLTDDEIKTYHDRGYIVIRNAISQETIELMRKVTDHIMTHPSGLLKAVNKSKFCGFSLHNHILIPEWRNISFNLPISSYAAQLMNTKTVVYSQDFIHATSPDCFDATKVAVDRNNNDNLETSSSESVGELESSCIDDDKGNTNRTATEGVVDDTDDQQEKARKTGYRVHSDMNQTPFSIEKSIDAYGDNMVVAWIGLDELDNKISMQLYDNTHKIYNTSESWDPYTYCKLWNEYETDNITNNNYKSQNVELHIGDVALFQGLTFHRVLKNISKCELNTCRRITIRYVDGMNTKWRTDVPDSMWPFIQELGNPGKYVIDDLAIVYDTRVSDVEIAAESGAERNDYKSNSEIKHKWNRLGNNDAIVPQLKYWFTFLWHVLTNGFKPSSIIFQCPNQQSYYEKS